MKYEVMVETIVDWYIVEADDEEQAKENAIDLARRESKWIATTREIE